MSDKIRAAATVLAISSAALIQAEINRNASGKQNPRKHGNELVQACPVMSADGYAIGTLHKLAPCEGRAGRMIVRTEATSLPQLPPEIVLPATAALDRHGRIVLPMTAADLTAATLPHAA